MSVGRILSRFITVNNSQTIRLNCAVIGLARKTKVSDATACFLNKVILADGFRHFSSSTGGSLKPQDKEIERKGKLNKVMKAYLDKCEAHEAYVKSQTHEYEVGKRHLANMMGEDPDTFTQEDVDNAIEYLMPTSLFDLKARPMMKLPEDFFLKRKGNVIYLKVTEKLLALEAHEDKMIASGIMKPEEDKKVEIGGTQFLSKEELEEMILEKLKDNQYETFTTAFNRLIAHPYSATETEFIMKYRKKFFNVFKSMEIPPLQYDENGVPYMEALGKRKHCLASVIVREGTGKLDINGKDISYFERLQDREQLMFPLHFSGKMNKVDVKARVEGPGISAQSGAIRHGISLALRSFLPPEEVERMRLAGLLTKDVRRRERKKPGQVGARRKHSWHKR